MNTIDLNDIVQVVLTQHGAEYINQLNEKRRKTLPKQYQEKLGIGYKDGDIYKDQLWSLILDFKDSISMINEKPFSLLCKKE